MSGVDILCLRLLADAVTGGNCQIPPALGLPDSLSFLWPRSLPDMSLYRPNTGGDLVEFKNALKSLCNCLCGIEIGYWRRRQGSETR